MTNKPDDKGSVEDEELRGWPFLGAIAVFVLLGSAYVAWKYYKHHVLLPQLLGPDMWVPYAAAFAGLMVWGIVTRFGSRGR
jgi:hypothetical protein